MLSFSSVGNTGGSAYKTITSGSRSTSMLPIFKIGGKNNKNNSTGMGTTESSPFDSSSITLSQMSSQLANLCTTASQSINNAPYTSTVMDPIFGIMFEDATKMPAAALTQFNNYGKIFKNAVIDTIAAQQATSYTAKSADGKKDESKADAFAAVQTHFINSPSNFNPYVSIQLKLAETPALMNSTMIQNSTTKTITGKSYVTTQVGNNTNAGEDKDIKVDLNLNTFNADIGNCSIKELVKLSSKKGSILGSARYRFADFMYCKDLGKVSNNHLITLRKYAHPVSDHIYRFSGGKWTSTSNEYGDMGNAGDVGRLISWFGTGDNKLEDILKYDVEATWKEFNSKIQEIDSQEDDAGRGPLGMILNSMNPAYNRMQAGGFTGNHNIVAWLMGKIHTSLGQPGQYQNSPALRMSANGNRIYEPTNRIKSVNLYEGTLKFAHEFTLTFSYKLRAYNNVNPKVALLDLMGNILEVTYRRGSFWGGATRMIGPPANSAGWNKANNMIDNAWNKLGGLWNAIMNGNFDIGQFFQDIASSVSAMYDQASEAVKTAVEGAGGGAGGVMRAGMQAIKKFNDKTRISDAIKGQIKNALGRPALYAADSLLSGAPTGLWHLTVGNPKNPIMAMGNLIMTKATIQHSGPLGIDDFPTEIKVTCTLKHGRPRDLTEIERMYCKGMSSIRSSLGGRSANKYFKFSLVGGNDNDKTEELYIYKALQEKNNTMLQTAKATTVADEAKSDKADNKDNKTLANNNAGTNKDPSTDLYTVNDSGIVSVNSKVEADVWTDMPDLLANDDIGNLNNWQNEAQVLSMNQIQFNIDNLTNSAGTSG